jgi:transcriptional regulator with XRE-family HTH domain
MFVVEDLTTRKVFVVEDSASGSAAALRVTGRWPDKAAICAPAYPPAMDPMQRFGARCRAVRIRHGWRQDDLSVRAAVSRSTISRIERGQFDHVTFSAIMAVSRALGIRTQLVAQWQGGDLDRLVNGGHARLHESVARWFGESLPGWILNPEVSYAIRGERGVIDIVAWHPTHRALIVIELKTDIVDVNDLIGSMDRRRRLAMEIAEARGWHPLTVSSWVIIADSRTNRARLAAHRSMLRNAFPVDGRSMNGWLRQPDREVAALSLWDRAGDSGRSGIAARHRVSRPRRPRRRQAG